MARYQCNRRVWSRGLPLLVVATLLLALRPSSFALAPLTAGAAQPPAPASLQVAGVELQLPTIIPTGYRLVNSSRQGHLARPDVDVMHFDYRDAMGHRLLIVQGWPVPYDDESYHAAPADQQGMATVQGHAAVWRYGPPLPGLPPASPQDAPPATVLSLRWQSGARTPSGDLVGYAVEADALRLEDLLAVADGLRPASTIPPGMVPAIPIPTGSTPVVSTPPPALDEVINLGHVAVRSDPNLQPPPSPASSAPPSLVIRSQPVSLEEAQALVDFPIVLPTWLPSPDFALVEVQELGAGTTPDPSVILIYREGGRQPPTVPARELVITQRRWSSIRSAITVPAVLEVGVIGGTPAAFWTVSLPGGKQGSFTRSYVLWELWERLITLNAAGLTRAEIVQVAESLRP